MGRSRTVGFMLGFVLCVAVMGVGLGVSAEELNGAQLFQTKTCFACHGPDAKTPLMPQYPKLAGQNYEYILQQFKDIRAGVRNNGQTAAMIGIAQTVSDPELEAIAKWLSSLKWCN